MPFLVLVSLDNSARQHNAADAGILFNLCELVMLEAKLEALGESLIKIFVGCHTIILGLSDRVELD